MCESCLHFSHMTGHVTRDTHEWVNSVLESCDCSEDLSPSYYFILNNMAIFHSMKSFIYFHIWITMPWLTQMCDNELFICVTWLIHIHMCDATGAKGRCNWRSMTRSHLCHDSLVCHIAHSNVWCDMTRWYMCCPRSRQVKDLWFNHTCDMTHWYVWHHSCICVTWLMCMCDMTDSCIWASHG